MTMTPDPVTLALVQNRLDHISHQMGWVMTRTARSPIFSQSHDFSCFIADARGILISQADGIPIHTGGGGFAVRAILRDFSGSDSGGIWPEDVFLLNDPYEAGGNHLPDWVIARPVFPSGRRGIDVAGSCFAAFFDQNMRCLLSAGAAAVILARRQVPGNEPERPEKLENSAARRRRVFRTSPPCAGQIIPRFARFVKRKGLRYYSP